MRVLTMPWLGGLGTAAAALLLDQATKVAVSARLNPYESVPMIGQVVRITHTRNPGIAFGISFGVLNGWALTLLSACGVAAIGIYLVRQRGDNAVKAAMVGLLLGGAAGNLVDRVRLGEVIDFLDVGIGAYRWPVFNVADSVVVIGVAVLLIIDRDARAPEKGPAES